MAPSLPTSPLCVQQTFADDHCVPVLGSVAEGNPAMVLAEGVREMEVPWLTSGRRHLCTWEVGTWWQRGGSGGKSDVRNGSLPGGPVRSCRGHGGGGSAEDLTEGSRQAQGKGRDGQGQKISTQYVFLEPKGDY